MIHLDYLTAQLEQRQGRHQQLMRTIQEGEQARIEAINLEGQMQVLKDLIDAETPAIPLDSLLGGTLTDGATPSTVRATPRRHSAEVIPR